MDLSANDRRQRLSVDIVTLTAVLQPLLDNWLAKHCRDQRSVGGEWVLRLLMYIMYSTVSLEIQLVLVVVSVLCMLLAYSLT